MEPIINFFQLDFAPLIINIFIVMAGVVGVVSLIGKFSEIIGKPASWVRKNNKDHELLLKTIQALDGLREKHEEDVSQSIKHDKAIKETLEKSVGEIQKAIDKSNLDIKQFSENRIHDREQSFQIQRELTQSIIHRQCHWD
ncbi:hypothetical protein [Hungatella hathewayi]|uniref:hypothetical protein n=1 Tax=Hungatella hathewayi TaxID=154046 RepID=UPI0035629E38